jgi:hypothetical protein
MAVGAQLDYLTGVSGETWYAVFRNKLGQLWNGSAYVAETTLSTAGLAAAYTSGAVLLPELLTSDAGGTGHYQATAMPSAWADARLYQAAPSPGAVIGGAASPAVIANDDGTVPLPASGSMPESAKTNQLQFDGGGNVYANTPTPLLGVLVSGAGNAAYNGFYWPGAMSRSGEANYILTPGSPSSPTISGSAGGFVLTSTELGAPEWTNGGQSVFGNYAPTSGGATGIVSVIPLVQGGLATASNQTTILDTLATISARTNLLTGGNLALVSGIGPSGVLELYKYAWYDESTGLITITNPGNWPAFAAGSTATLVIWQLSAPDTALLSEPGIIVDANTITFAPAIADMAVLQIAPNQYGYAAIVNQGGDATKPWPVATGGVVVGHG